LIIINADDWGRSRADTDAALACYREGRITSVTAMVFMKDSERAAELAKDGEMDVGLHVNLTQQFTGNCGDSLLRSYHNSIVRYLTGGRYRFLVYNPALRKAFQYAYQAQADEFIRLYGRKHSHVDGHHHMHLCANMLIGKVIPAGEKVRRNFTFFPGESGFVKVTYRRLVDRWLASRYRMTDFFFALSESMRDGRLKRIAKVAESASVELMAHPARAEECAFLLSDNYLDVICELGTDTYKALNS
jgi:predicted glycoside hydrolase/deacetylase ChbG (UPF0249 family)